MKLLVIAAALLSVALSVSAEPAPTTRIHSMSIMQYCGDDMAIHLVVVDEDSVNITLFVKTEIPAEEYSKMLEMAHKWEKMGGNMMTVELNKGCVRT